MTCVIKFRAVALAALIMGSSSSLRTLSNWQLSSWVGDDQKAEGQLFQGNANNPSASERKYH